MAAAMSNKVMLYRHEELVAKLEEWSQAYPLEVFPEPPADHSQATRSQCSASMGRHVISRLLELVGEPVEATRMDWCSKHGDSWASRHHHQPWDEPCVRTSALVIVKDRCATCNGTGLKTFGRGIGGQGKRVGELCPDCGGSR